MNPASHQGDLKVVLLSFRVGWGTHVMTFEKSWPPVEADNGD